MNRVESVVHSGRLVSVETGSNGDEERCRKTCRRSRNLHLVEDQEISTNLGSDLDGDGFSQSDRVKFDFGGDPPLDLPLLSLDTHTETQRYTAQRERERVMDGGEGWHGASLGLGSTGKRDKMMMVSREMLRFRPIAPKPVTDGSGSSYMLTEKKNSVVSKGRTKRKYVRVRKNSMNGYKKMVSEEESKDGVLKTLQLLPEKAEMKDPVDPTAEKVGVEVDNVEGGDGGGGGGSDLTVEMGQTRVVESWVTVESVADKLLLPSPE
ncbi:hypothetical protein CFP56_008509 [Quercus suber]|uniref:Uncharacterized protein n=1 Tax=Quercus suber TaxID=58331 RepID=A0AAW0L4N0_QUESU